MTAPRVAIATCRNIPEVDVDAPLLHEALVARGVRPELAAWDDPAADFASPCLCVVRSTWNYWLPGNLEPFLAWIERTAASTRLFNPPRVLRWNLHKGYLLELAAAGVAVVPTALVARGEERPLVDVMRALGAACVVVKPAVSGSSFSTLKVDRENLDQGEQHLRAVAAQQDVLVQPYLPSVEGWGERSIIYIDGAFTHAIRKSPRFGGEDESVSAALPIEPDERALAERALAEVPEPLLYARIDMARDDHGAPLLMELELVEPSLYLAQHPPALTRFADAIVARCAQRS
jgi:hypothetical protein